MARGAWAQAARDFADLYRLYPHEPAFLTQLGHARKEAGDRAGAIDAYRDASVAMPQDLDCRLHLVSLLRQAAEVRAVAPVLAEMLAIDPDNAVARRNAIEIGRRDLIAGDAAVDGLERLAETIDRAVHLAQAALAGAPVDATGYDRFRKRYPLGPPPPPPPPPPSSARAMPMTIMVEGQGCPAAWVHATLTSIRDIEGVAWHARVALDPAQRDHPVAGFVAIDDRIAIVDDVSAMSIDGVVLSIAAGTIVAPWGPAWLAYALDRSGADLAYGDHDHRERDWRDGDTWSAPTLYSAHDPLAFADDALAPPMLLARSGAIGRDRLRARCGVVHVPRVVASRHVASTVVRGAPEAEVLERVPVHVTADEDDHADTPIVVVIPTRDAAPLLVRAIETLRASARHPGRVAFVVLDNRSRDSATATALARLGVTIVPFDEPFNWSRANNIGAAAAGAQPTILVFANNDIEMTGTGWDVALAQSLADPAVGVVGVRLLYPGGTIQHGGILFATAPRALALHDGIHAPADAPGPAGRWQRRRSVAAVTGAFLAVTRATFDRLGGFDEQLFVAYGDLDFCLRARDADRLVVYEPGIAAIHHESATRGHNRTASQIAFDEEELGVFARRWPGWLSIDPGYNPQWATGGVPYDGFREPPLSEIDRHIDLARGASSWRIGGEGPPA